MPGFHKNAPVIQVLSCDEPSSPCSVQAHSLPSAQDCSSCILQNLFISILPDRRSDPLMRLAQHSCGAAASNMHLVRACWIKLPDSNVVHTAVIRYNSESKVEFSWARRQAPVPLIHCCHTLPWSRLVGTHCEQVPRSQKLLSYLSMRVCLAMSCSTVILRRAPSKIVFLTTGATVRSKG